MIVISTKKACRVAGTRHQIVLLRVHMGTVHLPRHHTLIKTAVCSYIARHCFTASNPVPLRAQWM